MTIAPVARRPSTLPALALIVASVFAVFGRAGGFDFVHFDDRFHLADNPDMNPVSAHSLAAFWRGTYKGMYIPATYTAWGVLAGVARVPDGRGATLNPYVFHLANVGLHAINAGLVWWVLRRVLGPGATAGATVGALAFALHPLQAEPVAWVSGFKDTFSGFWSLLAIGLFLRPGRAAYAGATACAAVALLAKPAAVVVPPVAWVLAWAAGRPPRAAAVALVPWVVLVAAYAVVTHAQQADAGLMAWNPPAVRPLVVADAVAFYARKVAWPADLCVDYGRTPRWVWDHWAAASVGIGTVAVGVAALLAAGRRWGRAVPAGVAVFALGLGPVLGAVPFLYQQFSTVSDRYAYLSLLGVGLAAGRLVEVAGRRGVAVAGVVVCGWAGVTFAQVGTWRDTRSLFTRVVAINPGSALAHGWLGVLAGEAHDWPTAEREARSAAAANPAEPIYAMAVSRALAHQGRPDESRAWYATGLVAAAARVLALDPDAPTAHRSLAQAYQLQGRPAAAAAESATADRLRAQGHVDPPLPGH